MLERDSTGPNPIYPNEGTKLSLRARITPPWFHLLDCHQGNNGFPGIEACRWKEYHQWMLDGSYFSRLLDNLVLNVRGHMGVMGNFSSQGGITPFERFYLGGTMPSERAIIRGKEHISLRGYAEDYIVPQDKTTGYKGGVIYEKFVVELRYPIISNYIAHTYALVFAEAGNAWAKYEDFNPFSLKRSVGVGLRFYLPMILGTTVGFDWGYGFDRHPGDETDSKLKFHFSVGMELR